MSPTTRSREKAQQNNNTKASVKSKNQNEIIPNNITIITKNVRKVFQKKDKQKNNSSDNNSTTEGMELDDEDTYTVASTSSNTEPLPTQPVPPVSSVAETASEKGKEKVPDEQLAAAENTNTNQNALPEDAVFEKITRRTQYKAATLFTNIKGKNKTEKYQTVCKQFGNIQGYAGKITQTIRGSTYMVIFFDTEDEMITAIDKTFPLTIHTNTNMFHIRILDNNLPLKTKTKKKNVLFK